MAGRGGHVARWHAFWVHLGSATFPDHSMPVQEQDGDRAEGEVYEPYP